MRRQALRSLAKTDIYAFGEYVFGLRPAAHHRAMVDFAMERIDRGENGIILAPRGAAKTTWLNTILGSFLVATRPDIRIGLFSQKDKKAEAMSFGIRSVLADSEPFKELFGDLRSPTKWTDSEWLRKGSKWAASKDRTMVTGGVNNSSAVSKRLDLVLCDDILDAENTYNIDRREKTEDWFWKTMKPAQAAEGASIIVFGTTWTEGDLYARLIDTNHWPSLVISAIDKDTEESYWPEVWPLERLYKEREDIGYDNFACSYLNDISGSREGLIFKRDWWDPTGYFDELPRDRKFLYTMGVDLASSERERADFTARVILAEDEFHEHWILSAVQTKIESGHRQFVQDGAAAFPGISKIKIENNQHQSTLVQDLLNETNLPVVGVRADTEKRSRHRAIAARYESHRVHHHRSLKGGDLENQLTGYPHGHDDLLDALYMAMDITVSQGSIGAATTPQIATKEAQMAEVRFNTGSQQVPAYLAQMLDGVDTERLTRDEAIAAANRNAEARFIRNALRIPGLR